MYKLRIVCGVVVGLFLPLAILGAEKKEEKNKLVEKFEQDFKKLSSPEEVVPEEIVSEEIVNLCVNNFDLLSEIQKTDYFWSIDKRFCYSATRYMPLLLPKVSPQVRKAYFLHFLAILQKPADRYTVIGNFVNAFPKNEQGQFWDDMFFDRDFQLTKYLIMHFKQELLNKRGKEDLINFIDRFDDGYTLPSGFLFLYWDELSDEERLNFIKRRYEENIEILKQCYNKIAKNSREQYLTTMIQAILHGGNFRSKDLTPSVVSAAFLGVFDLTNNDQKESAFFCIKYILNSGWPSRPSAKDIFLCMYEKLGNETDKNRLMCLLFTCKDRDFYNWLLQNKLTREQCRELLMEVCIAKKTSLKWSFLNDIDSKIRELFFAYCLVLVIEEKNFDEELLVLLSKCYMVMPKKYFYYACQRAYTFFEPKDKSKFFETYFGSEASCEVYGVDWFFFKLFNDNTDPIDKVLLLSRCWPIGVCASDFEKFLKKLEMGVGIELLKRLKNKFSENFKDGYVGYIENIERLNCLWDVLSEEQRAKGFGNILRNMTLFEREKFLAISNEKLTQEFVRKVLASLDESYKKACMLESFWPFIPEAWRVQCFKQLLVSCEKEAQQEVFDAFCLKLPEKLRNKPLEFFLEQEKTEHKVPEKPVLPTQRKTQEPVNILSYAIRVLVTGFLSEITAKYLLERESPKSKLLPVVTGTLACSSILSLYAKDSITKKVGIFVAGAMGAIVGIARAKKMVSRVGIEPTTHSLRGCCSTD